MPKVALRHILKDDIIYISSTDGQPIVLHEPQNGNRPKTLQDVEIIDVPDDTLILCVDKMSSPLFRQDDNFCQCHDQSKYRRKCDYIILTEFDCRNYLIYIEMKTSPRDPRHIPQLWCGRCFMEYLNFAMENLEHIKPSSGYLHRFVKFCKVLEDKDSTDIQGDGYKQNNKQEELNDLPGKAFLYFVTAGVPVPLKDLIYEYNH